MTRPGGNPPLSNRSPNRSLFRPALSRLAVLLMPLVLGACAGLPGTSYTSPDVTMPGTWQHAEPVAGLAGNGSATLAEDRWWRQFGDAKLDALIEDVLAHNANLAAAAVQVRRAQLEAGLARSDMLPTPFADYSGTRTRSLSNGASSRSHSAEVGVSYEVDLWGKLAKLHDAAQWEALATEQDRDSTRLSLIGTAATLYWKLAYLDERLASGEASIAYAQQVLKLVQAQRQAGASSALEVYEAEQNVASQQSSQTLLAQQRVAARMSLAALLDDPAGTRIPAVTPIEAQVVPAVEAGMPAELLGRRPDLRAAELRLRKALVTVDATRASYYPTLSLTGSVGGASTALVDLLKNPIGTLGAGVALPFLRWNEMQLTVKVSQADYESAVASFRQTLYVALTDVEVALSARSQYALQGEQLVRALDAARAAERVYQVRYRSGMVSLRIWLDAQESRRSAERSLAENRYNQLAASVTLYQALGGGVGGEAVAKTGYSGLTAVK